MYCPLRDPQSGVDVDESNVEYAQLQLEAFQVQAS